MIVQLSHYTSKDIISQCSIALKKNRWKVVDKCCKIDYDKCVKSDDEKK